MGRKGGGGRGWKVVAAIERKLKDGVWIVHYVDKYPTRPKQTCTYSLVTDTAAISGPCCQFRAIHQYHFISHEFTQSTKCPLEK